jgi:MFS family permease
MARTGRTRPAQSRRYDVDGYRAVLSLPGTAAFFVPAAFARLGVAMTGLAILWVVQGATGSFADAGLATAAFAVAEAVAGPQIARLIDTHGQRRVLCWTLPPFALAAGALVVGSALALPIAVLATLAGISGVLIPQVNALAAARWRQAVGDTDRMPAALSLEAALNDVTFLIGPILVSTLSAGIAGFAGLIVSTLLIVVGLAVFLSRRSTEPRAERSSQRSRRTLFDRRLFTRSFLALIAINLAMGLFFGAISLNLTAFAVAHDASALAGPIAATSSITSLLAGLVYGARGRSVSPFNVLGVAAIVLVVGCAGLSTVSSVLVMFVAYGVVGGAVALVLVPGSVLLQRVTRKAVYTQAVTWINSASVTGIAVAGPIVGAMIERHGWQAGFITTALLLTALPLSIVIGHRAITADSRLQQTRPATEVGDR